MYQDHKPIEQIFHHFMKLYYEFSYIESTYSSHDKRNSPYVQDGPDRSYRKFRIQESYENIGIILLNTLYKNINIIGKFIYSQVYGKYKDYNILNIYITYMDKISYKNFMRTFSTNVEDLEDLKNPLFPSNMEYLLNKSTFVTTDKNFVNQENIINPPLLIDKLKSIGHMILEDLTLYQIVIIPSKN